MRNLDKFVDSKKDFECGVAEKFTITIDGVEHFFKVNDVLKDGCLRYDQSVNEVLVSNFLKKIGAKHFVEYNLASFQDKIGCFCKTYCDQNTIYDLEIFDILVLNYLNKRDGRVYPIERVLDKDIINTAAAEYGKRNFMQGFCDENTEYSFSLPSVLREVKIFAKNYGFEVDEKQIAEVIEEMVVCDYFVRNNDRNWSNMGVLIKDQVGPKIEFAPIFDNGYAFGLHFKDRNLKQNSALPNFSILLGLSEVGTVKNFDESFLGEGGVVAVDIYDLAHKNPHIAEMVDEILRTDMGKIVDDFELKNGVEIEPGAREYPKIFFNNRVKKYKKIAQKLDNKLLKNQFEK